MWFVKISRIVTYFIFSIKIRWFTLFFMLIEYIKDIIAEN